MLTRSLDREKKWRAAINAALFILAILVVSALLGLKVLSVFGISLDVFRIVGGMIIAYMGFDMLRGRSLVGQAPPSESEVNTGGSLAPLIMFAAGPGTITAVVTLAAVHTPEGLPWTALAAAVVGTAVTFVILLLSIRIHGPHRSVDGNAIHASRAEGLFGQLVAFQCGKSGLRSARTKAKDWIMQRPSARLSQRR
jgi:multiple antibiotic resistance protein